MTFLAIDVGNTRLKWALYDHGRPGAQLQQQGAVFLEAIDALADGDWKAAFDRNLGPAGISAPPPPPLEARPLPPMRDEHIDASTGEDEMALADRQPQGPARNAPMLGTSRVPSSPTDPSTWGKVSRNEPCPCGSGKKFKHCHGAVMA